MNTYGCVRVASAIPSLEVGNIDYNVGHIISMIDNAASHNVDVILFPELCITGYTCADLFHLNIKDKVDKALSEIHEHVKNICAIAHKRIVAIVGAPRFENGSLFNSAFIIHCESIDWVDKTFLPNYNEFYEKRWFKAGDNSTIFELGDNVKFGVEICEDVWSPISPSTKLCLQGADIIFNLSASNDLIGKYDYLKDLLKMSSAKNICGYVYAGAGFGESTQDLVFDGKGFIFENGHMLNCTERFITDEKMIISDIDVEAIHHDRIANITYQDSKIEYDYYNVVNKSIKANTPDDGTKVYRSFNPHPFYSNDEANNAKRFNEIFNIQVLGLMKRLKHIGAKAVIGVSGGSDSTLALLVCKEAMKRLKRPSTDIIAITMPGFATSERTLNNSIALAKQIGADLRVIDIKESCEAELKALNHSLTDQDVTYENVQARMRTSILMNIANKEGGIVIGTGDLSELALGWCTYNGDHMSMYAVNSSIPKTLVKRLIRWYADNSDKDELKATLLDVLDTPVSPELTGTGAEGENKQVTEDNIGPYELHDFFLYNMFRFGFNPSKIEWMANHTSFDVKYSPEEIKKWLNVFIKRFFNNQFKRSCLPDGPKVGSITLSPRGDWRMPSDASYNLVGLV